MLEFVLDLTVGYALVAQRIERLPPEQKVTGSNPVEGAIANEKQGRFRKREPALRRCDIPSVGG
jgi:hypothetical protein